MTELKTLKDFYCDSHGEYGCCYKEGTYEYDSSKYPHSVDTEDLRKEVIKHLRELKEKKIAPSSSAIWIKNFFNITEEDLK